MNFNDFFKEDEKPLDALVSDGGFSGKFRKNFYLEGHMTPTGYLLTGKMVASYIDYIIRHNMPKFKRVGFIGSGI